ncbi:MAG: polyketide cyclase [Actinobacteria bacterium]|nr:polyketide cyclase [Actinomycetota bacterium]
MAELPYYRFDTAWRVRADAGAVWDVLYDVPSYPAWWPQVKDVGELNGEHYDVLIRSFLPYNLRFTLGQSVADRKRGVLEAGLEGDLNGFSRWTIRPAPAGAILRFEEQVITTKAILNRLDAIARPAFRANHWWMMRDGERGLQTFMAGHRFATRGPAGKHQEVAHLHSSRNAQAR